VVLESFKIDEDNSTFLNQFMAEIPRLRKRSDRRTINISIDEEIEELYRVAKQNGYDSSEIARRAVTDVFKKLEPELKRPAS
jgi:uncharacterized protein (UPF0335 family)